MKSTLALGIFATTLTLFSCAPVATSSPKMATLTPHSAGDAITSDNSRFDLRIVSKTIVITADQYDATEKKLDADYGLKRFDVTDAKLSELRTGDTMANLELAASLNRADIVTILIEKSGTKISEQSIADLKIDWLRSETNVFAFNISKDDAASAKAWSTIKPNLVAVVIASREAKKK
jgi:hypothetical protein